MTSPSAIRFLHAYDLALTTQISNFKVAEDKLTAALDELRTYYDANVFRSNPSKTQTYAFHLRNLDGCADALAVL